MYIYTFIAILGSAFGREHGALYVLERRSEGDAFLLAIYYLVRSLVPLGDFRRPDK
jgi:hypothetical protein